MLKKPTSKPSNPASLPGSGRFKPVAKPKPKPQFFTRDQARGMKGNKQRAKTADQQIKIEDEGEGARRRPTSADQDQMKGTAAEMSTESKNMSQAELIVKKEMDDDFESAAGSVLPSGIQLTELSDASETMQSSNEKQTVQSEMRCMQAFESVIPAETLFSEGSEYWHKQGSSSSLREDWFLDPQMKQELDGKADLLEGIVKKDEDMSMDVVEKGLDPLTLPFIGNDYLRVNDASNLKLDNLTLFQLPPLLPLQSGTRDSSSKMKQESAEDFNVKQEPALKGPSDGVKQGNVDKSKSSRSHQIGELPNGFATSGMKTGKIGTIKTHRSGRMTFHIGNVSYDMSPGINSSLKETICRISTGMQELDSGADKKAETERKVDASTQSKSCFEELGAVRSRILCTPNLNSLLRRT